MTSVPDLHAARVASAATHAHADTPLDADTARLAEALIEQLGPEEAVMLAVQIIQRSASHLPTEHKHETR